MKKTSFILGSALIAGFFIIAESCTKKSAEPLVCFQEDVLPLMISHCATAGCHNPVDHEEGYDFTTYEGVMKGVSKGHARRSEIVHVIREGEMPPAGYPQLTDDELTAIERWIDLGAVNSSNCNSGGCDTAVFTYSGAIQPMLQTYCVGCHYNGAPNAPYDLSNFTEVQGIALNGVLTGVVNHENGYVPMPSNGPQLSDCQRTVIQKWIDAGAPNN